MQLKPNINPNVLGFPLARTAVRNKFNVRRIFIAEAQHHTENLTALDRSSFPRKRESKDVGVDVGF
jgi:hypothetical protein